MRIVLLAGMLIATFVGVCPAAETDVAGSWSSVAPFVNENTVAVVSVDLPKIDLAAIEKEALGSVDRSDAQKANAANIIGKWKSWSTQLAAQGGGRIYFVFTVEFQPNLLLLTEQEILKAVFVVIPTANGLTSGQIRDVEDTFPFKLRKLRKVDVLADGSLLDKLANFQSAPRPDFEQAMTAAGDRPVRIAVVPPDILQRAAKEILLQPAPGQDKPVGQVLADGLQWLGVGIDPNVNTFNVVGTIQSKDNAAAATFLATLKIFVEQVSQQLNRRGADDSGPSLTKALVSLLPEQKDNRLVLSYTKERAAGFVAFFKQTLGLAQASSARQISISRMKQLNLAILTYEDKYKTLPERAIRSKDGKPLLSWRVAMLPYIDELALYKEFHLDEPWDSEHNRKLVDRMPEIYQDAVVVNRQAGRTRYLAPVGESLYFAPDRALTFKDIKDGTSKTIMLVEADPKRAVTWTKPDDLEVDLNDPARGLGAGDDVFNASFGDGSVSVISVSIPKEQLRGLFTRDGGELVDR